MPRALSHAVVLTDDLDATLRFLGEIAKIAPVSDVSEGAPEDYSLVFGWPLEQAATRSAFVGEGAGMLEVVEIPAALRGTVAPGVRLLAVANRDVAATADTASAAGFEVRGPLTVTERGGARRDDRGSGGRRDSVRADPVRLIASRPGLSNDHPSVVPRIPRTPDGCSPGGVERDRVRRGRSPGSGRARSAAGSR